MELFYPLCLGLALFCLECPSSAPTIFLLWVTFHLLQESINPWFAANSHKEIFEMPSGSSNKASAILLSTALIYLYADLISLKNLLFNSSSHPSKFSMSNLIILPDNIFVNKKKEPEGSFYIFIAVIALNASLTY